MIAKGLVWRENLNYGGWYNYDYSITPDIAGGFTVVSRHSTHTEWIAQTPTEAEAKAAAQRHADEVVANMLSPEARYALIVGIERVTTVMHDAEGYRACAALNLLRKLNRDAEVPK